MPGDEISDPSSSPYEVNEHAEHEVSSEADSYAQDPTQLIMDTEEGVGN